MLDHHYYSIRHLLRLLRRSGMRWLFHSHTHTHTGTYVIVGDIGQVAPSDVLPRPSRSPIVPGGSWRGVALLAGACSGAGWAWHSLAGPGLAEAHANAIGERMAVREAVQWRGSPGGTWARGTLSSSSTSEEKLTATATPSKA